ncbi:hypothetical protein CN601_26110 [Bacillus sp. AFS017336]|nr:hypothetical protein CN601_26110 [Bacillus sp. AFS017336]
MLKLKDVLIIIEAVLFSLSCIILKFFPDINYSKGITITLILRVILILTTLILGAVVSVWYTFF